MSKIEMIQKEIKACPQLTQLRADRGFLSTASPYRLPRGYFNNLAERILQRLNQEASVDLRDELEMIAPKLVKIQKENPYRAPQGYFEKEGLFTHFFTTDKTPRMWWVRAKTVVHRGIAAILIGVIALSGLIYYSAQSKYQKPEVLIQRATDEQLSGFLNEGVSLSGQNTAGMPSPQPSLEHELQNSLNVVPKAELTEFLETTATGEGSF